MSRRVDSVENGGVPSSMWSEWLMLLSWMVGSLAEREDVLELWMYGSSIESCTLVMSQGRLVIEM